MENPLTAFSNPRWLLCTSGAFSVGAWRAKPLQAEVLPMSFSFLHLLTAES
jgi:hypothetical protein